MNTFISVTWWFVMSMLGIWSAIFIAVVLAWIAHSLDVCSHKKHELQRYWESD